LRFSYRHTRGCNKFLTFIISRLRRPSVLRTSFSRYYNIIYYNEWYNTALRYARTIPVATSVSIRYSARLVYLYCFFLHGKLYPHNNIMRVIRIIYTHTYIIFIECNALYVRRRYYICIYIYNVILWSRTGPMNIVFSHIIIILLRYGDLDRRPRLGYYNIQPSLKDVI